MFYISLLPSPVTIYGSRAAHSKELLRNNFAFCAEWVSICKAEKGVVVGYDD